ncbi:MAG: hypothetical protein AUI10_06675 [Actinobacteria bacterium 13_2_20CM_2_72_6]|nr:MAG: hypothetical protein AUI10_06675 [Actinobacteria bacterium 13_2_20CM_2_72_6]
MAPETTIRPPCVAHLRECSKVAAPTVSITTSTRSGNRAPGSSAVAPSAAIRSRLPGSRLVAYTRAPSATARTTAAVATPPPAPWTSTEPPSGSRPRTVSIRYAVSHAVGRHAASAKDSSGGLGTRLRRGTRTRSAKVPGHFSDSAVRFGSIVSSPDDGSPTIACTTTSVPSSATPAASQPRIIGNLSAGSPTPRSDQRS